MAAWLNLASGAVGVDEFFDTDSDSIPETPFIVMIQDIEAILLDSGTTHTEFVFAKDLAEAINVLDVGAPACE